jgi:aminopeptidase N
MSSHLTDKSLQQESRFSGWALRGPRPFAEAGTTASYAPDRSHQIEEIDLDLSVDPVAKTLVGVARIRVQTLPGNNGPLRLHLEELAVQAVEGEAGPLRWRHADGILTVEEAKGGWITVRYSGSPRKGIYWVGATPAEPHRLAEAWTQCQDEDARFIFPCFDHPSVKHPYKLQVTVPAGFGVVSNGRLVGEHPIPPGNFVRWSWEQREPMPAYLFSRVVMKMEVQADAWDGIPVRYAVPAGTDPAVVQRVFGNTPKMVEFLSGMYGRYPWPRYDQVVVHDFIFGGMENIAATTLIDIVLTDERAALDWDAEDLIVHELAHQWFGDLVTCQDWSQGWLNEGWATWTEHHWIGHSRGKDEGIWHLWEQCGQYLEEDGGRYRRPIVSYLFRAPIDLFDRHLYEKGALVLHSLRTLMGAEAFWAGVHHYLKRHRYGTVHTRDFQRALEESSGRNLDRFFAEMIFGAGHATLEVNLSHADGLLSVGVKQTQSGEGVAEIFHLPLRIRIDGRDVVVQLDARERCYLLPCAEAPTCVQVDPDFEILSEISLKGSRSLLIAALKEGSSPPMRVRAARGLAKEGSPEAITALETALQKDNFWGVRAEIAEIFGQRGGEVARRVLKAALTDPHPKTRKVVVAAIGRLGSPEDAALLPQSDLSLQVEGEILRSLGRLRAPEARARAEAALAGPSGWMELLRCRALEALGLLRDPAVLDTLLGWTSEKHPTRARAAAAAALGRLGDEVEAVRLPIRERLCLLSESEDYRLKIAAINALGVLKDPGALATLERVHSSAGDGRARRLAAEAMANIREGRSTEAGLAGLRRDLESLRSESQKLRDGLSRLEQRK